MIKRFFVVLFMSIFCIVLASGGIAHTNTVEAATSPSSFMIKYHADNSESVSNNTTTVEYGVSTKILTIAELNFNKEGKEFEGWRAYREVDNKWYLKDGSGKSSWQSLNNGNLPEGYSYSLYKNGTTVAKTAPEGVVHLYAQWKNNEYTIKYHPDDSNATSNKTTLVQYGVSTKIMTLAELNFSKAGKDFVGWRAYRDYDKKWYLKDSNGKSSWQSLNDGNLPAGYSYSLYKDGISVSKTAPRGVVHLYAQWKDRGYTIKYHADSDTEGTAKDTTFVPYGISTKILSIANFNFFNKAGKDFEGWRASREYDKKWYLRGSDGKSSWQSLNNGNLPVGYSYSLYKDGITVAKTAPNGVVHLYAQWKDGGYTVKYHADDTSAAAAETTYVPYGVSTKLRTISQFNYFNKSGKDFEGWKVHRESDDKWYLKDVEGKSSWQSLINGKLPDGYVYSLYKDGSSVAKTAPRGVVHLHAQWKNGGYTVKYHSSDTAGASSQTTYVPYGVSTKILKVSALNFSKTGKEFVGWRVYRESDGKWYLKDVEGKSSWQSLINGNLPDGYVYSLYKDGISVAKTAPRGIVHLYAQWKNSKYTIYYHEDDESGRSSDTTDVEYGVPTQIRKIADLNFVKEKKKFKNWKVYREIDQKWYLKDADGKSSWQSLVNGDLPEGYVYSCYGDGITVSKTATGGIVHLYAQWEDSGYTIKYHEDDNAEASLETTYVEYGTQTNILTVSELNFSKEGKKFKNWKVYREIDDKWYLKDANGNSSWQSLIGGALPEGYSYSYYADGTSVSKTATGGIVHLYGQWEDDGFTINYHEDDNAEPSPTTTYVKYGEQTNIKTIAELNFSKEGKNFKGWKVYREIDDKWYLKDNEGNSSWQSLLNGELPDGYDYSLYSDGTSVAMTAQRGLVHLYAQWIDDSFVIKYYPDMESEAAEQSTTVVYEIPTQTLSFRDLGLRQENKFFNGWIVHRDIDNKWRLKDADNNQYWQSLDNGKLPEGREFVIYPDACTVSSTAREGEVHFYAQWLEGPLNVSDFGADGNDQLSDWAAIQKCLNYGKDYDEHLIVNVGPGTYYIDDVLTVYSNTELVLDENAEIVRLDQTKLMLKSENDFTTGGYGQSDNITIRGGKWNGNITSLETMSSTVMVFNHAQGITLQDAEIGNFSSRHMVAFDGVKDVVVRNVKFSDQKAYTGEDDGAEVYEYHIEYKTDATHNPDNSFKNMEALHIDYISSDGVSAGDALPVDGTMSSNILVENCTFTDVFSGVGSHYDDNTSSRNNGIVIRNNTFKDVKYLAMHVCKYNNAEIYNNTATDVGELLRINRSTGSVYNNVATIKNSLIVNSPNYKFHGISVYADSNLSSVKNNTVTGSIYNGITIMENSEVGELNGNSFNNSGQYGVVIENAKVLDMSENTIDTTGDNGVLVKNSEAEFQGNLIKNTSGQGISLIGSKCTKINNNVMENIGKHFIILNNNSTADEILGNTIDTNTGTSEDGIIIDNGSEVGLIKQNIISNIVRNGIAVYRNSTVDEIIENEISTISSNGIALNAASATKINGNTISDVQSSDGIHLNQGTGSCTVQEVCNNIITNVGRRGIGIWNGANIKKNENNIIN